MTTLPTPLLSASVGSYYGPIDTDYLVVYRLFEYKNGEVFIHVVLNNGQTERSGGIAAEGIEAYLNSLDFILDRPGEPGYRRILHVKVSIPEPPPEDPASASYEIFTRPLPVRERGDNEENRAYVFSTTRGEQMQTRDGYTTSLDRTLYKFSDETNYRFQVYTENNYNPWTSRRLDLAVPYLTPGDYYIDEDDKVHVIAGVRATSATEVGIVLVTAQLPTSDANEVGNPISLLTVENSENSESMLTASNGEARTPQVVDEEVAYKEVDLQQDPFPEGPGLAAKPYNKFEVAGENYSIAARRFHLHEPHICLLYDKTSERSYNAFINPDDIRHHIVTGDLEISSDFQTVYFMTKSSGEPFGYRRTRVEPLLPEDAQTIDATAALVTPGQSIMVGNQRKTVIGRTYYVRPSPSNLLIVTTSGSYTAPLPATETTRLLLGDFYLLSDRLPVTAYFVHGRYTSSGDYTSRLHTKVVGSLRPDANRATTRK
ncbi:hypothetical protein ACTWM0_13300 [Pseudomonas machongensis]